MIDRDTVTKLAREADLWLTSDEHIAAIERFAALVAAAEREACAQTCLSLFDLDDDSCSEAEQCAIAIRARSHT